MQLRIGELKIIVKAYGRPVSGNKSKLVDKTFSGPIDVDIIGLCIDVIKGYFIKPLLRKIAFQYSCTNESMVF